MGTLDARARIAVTASIGVVLVWSLASLTMPRTDVGSFVLDPVAASIGPMTMLPAIASDRPTTALDITRDKHPDVIPAIVSAEADTRSALLWVLGGVFLPASLIAISRLASGVVRRGPPFSFAT